MFLIATLSKGRVKTDKKYSQDDKSLFLNHKYDFKISQPIHSVYRKIGKIMRNKSNMPKRKSVIKMLCQLKKPSKIQDKKTFRTSFIHK